jgi:type II secretory pathway predicted ATPase ExeA
MTANRLLSLWGLKWNPFSPELPHDALLVTPKLENFAWRVEQLVQEGGFALITGESGTGKSVVLRSSPNAWAVRDVVGVLKAPVRTADFYHGVGDVFSVTPLRIAGVASRRCAAEATWLRRASNPYC